MISFRTLSGDSGRVLREYLENTDSVAAAREYYEFGAEQGQWLGSLAAQWGLVGRAGGPEVELLFDGINPVTGDLLAQRRRLDARAGFDFTFSAPKSVSIIAIEDPRIQVAFRRSVEMGFAELEAFAQRRVRSGDAAWSRESATTGSLAAACYVHHDSRAGDPNLHAHVATFNVTDDGAGKLYALETGAMSQAIRRNGYGRLAYWHTLSAELIALGYQIERGEFGQPEIVGISDDVHELFSKRSREMEAATKQELDRRKEVLEDARSHGIQDRNLRDWLSGRKENWSDLTACHLSNNEMGVVARTSRKFKQHANPSEQREGWMAEMSEDQRSVLRSVVALARRNAVTSLPFNGDLERAITHAVEHVYERSSVAPQHQVLAAAMDHSLGAFPLQVAKSRIPLGVVEGRGTGIHCTWTTEEHLERERWCIAEIHDRRDSVAPIETHFKPEILGADEQWKPGKVSNQQAEVIRGLLESRDAIVALRGVAGAGKTASLQVFDRSASERDFNIIYLAPTHEAVGVLKSTGFSNATTISGFLADEKMRAAIPDQSVIVVDEAGLVSTMQGEGILRAARDCNARVILVGDAAQHSSVEAGDFLRTMATHSDLQTFELTEIHRQQHAEYRSAAKLMATGRVEEGLGALDRLGWIIETPTPELSIADDYLSARSAGQDYISIAPTHSIIQKSTDAIRSGLVQRKMLGELAVTVTIL